MWYSPGLCGMIDSLMWRANDQIKSRDTHRRNWQFNLRSLHPIVGIKTEEGDQLKVGMLVNAFVNGGRWRMIK